MAQSYKTVAKTKLWRRNVFLQQYYSVFFPIPVMDAETTENLFYRRNIAFKISTS